MEWPPLLVLLLFSVAAHCHDHNHDVKPTPATSPSPHDNPYRFESLASLRVTKDAHNGTATLRFTSQVAGLHASGISITERGLRFPRDLTGKILILPFLTHNNSVWPSSGLLNRTSNTKVNFWLLNAEKYQKDIEYQSSVRSREKRDIGQLIFSNKIKLLQSFKGRLEGIYLMRMDANNEVAICTRHENMLIAYKYVAANGAWSQTWQEAAWGEDGKHPSIRYPWLVTDILGNGNDEIMLRSEEGVSFYQPCKAPSSGLRLLTKDRRFHDVYGWNNPDHTLLWGHFYPNTKIIGVLTRNGQNVIKFYSVRKDRVLSNDSYPLWELQKKVSFTPIWSADETELFVTKLRHNDPETIGLRTTKGLEFYQFNANYLLEKVVTTSQITKSVIDSSAQDHLFFGDLTNQMYQDILHLNDSGLFIYQYNNSQQDYRFLNRCIDFTQPHGWLPSYSNSIRLMDLNSDGRDDLLFSGPQGITALSFDATANTWKTLIDCKQLSGVQRYATIVGILPPVPPAISQPSIFTQDADGKLEWAKVIPAPAPPPPTTATTTTTTSTTTTTTTATTNSVPSTRNLSASTIIRHSMHRKALVPEQVTRRNLPEKPILRWSEQWDDSFLKNPVDPASGQVRMHVPLLDVFAVTGWRLQLALSYNSQATTSDLIGVGWSLPVAQDYILVDYQGSIYPKNARYYLVAQGGPQRLNLIKTERGIQSFRLAEGDETAQLSIAYHQSAQRWIIQGKSEKTTYGKAFHSEAQDALKWSLGWPNWRGIGRDKAQLQPLITAWYLNMRLDKATQRTLFYHYEKDKTSIAPGKTYDAALRLKTISDGQYMRLSLDYTPKESSEYTSSDPVNKEGNIIFPTPLAQSHYLQGYSLTTASYSQTLKFAYVVNYGKRFLTALQQQLLLHTEQLLKFSYQTVLNKEILHSCTLVPRGSSVKFDHETITPPVIPMQRRYGIRESPQIAYGLDYAIVAYRDLDQAAGKVILHIMDRTMTKTILDCSVSTALSCPLAASEIKDYALEAYENSFIVSTESPEKRALYVYNRHEQTWSTDPSIYWFSNQALIHFSETLIAVAEPDENNIKLFNCAHNQSDWSNQTLTTPRAITALAAYNGLVVVYDDHQLWLFHFDVQTGWKKQLLDSKEITSSRTLALFDLEPEGRQRIVKALNHNSLQILSNCIFIHTLQESNGWLSSFMHLYLLDSRYNIAKKQLFEKRGRKNVYHISHESGSQDGNIVYHLGYTKEDGLLKVTVKDISGKAIEDIQNKNRRVDQIEALKQQTNQGSDFQNLAKKYVFSDLNFHVAAEFTAQISQQGVFVGNDTFLRITGTGWEKESLPSGRTDYLGKYFILETDGDKRSLLKLYKQDSNGNKQGQPIQELLHVSGQSINRYPAYIAYHPEPNLVKVLTFKDEQTLGQVYTFHNEKLHPSSDLKSFITLGNASSTTMTHAEPQECRVRPVSTLLPPKVQLFVKQMILAASDTERVTAYERSFSADTEASTYSETVTIIPGSNKSAYGWHEATRSYNRGNVTKSERWFNADGGEVIAPSEHASTEQAANVTDSSSMLLLTRNRKLLVSDFSPYSLADEGVAYYGFEPYENNQIGTPVNNTMAKVWHTKQAQIVKGKFAFTGEHYLQLKSNTTDHPSFLEGVFHPRDQASTYLAACWIRCTAAPMLHRPVPYFKAIIKTSNRQKVISLQAQAKYQLGDWSYLELLLNFQVLRQLYRDFVNYNATTASTNVLPSPDDVSFEITLRVEAPANQMVDLDHIRFSPLTHEFQAAIYHTLIDKPTAFIQANGLVTRTIYNRLNQEIASTDEEGQLQEFSSSSRTGNLVPDPKGVMINSKTNIVTFEPEYGSYETFDTHSCRSRWKIDDLAAWRIAPGQLWHRQPGNHRIQARSHLFDGKSAAIRCYVALQKSRSALSLNWQGIGSLNFTRQSDHASLVALPNGQSIAPLPSAGELIVMVEQNYLWLWVDGVLLADQELPMSQESPIASLTPWASFSLEAQGEVLVEDCLVMNRPQVTIKYYNAFGEKTQVIQLEDARTAQVNEILYDVLGREAITTKLTRVSRNANESILAYRSDFVSNKIPTHPQSVWHTHILQGEVNRLNPADEGFAYKRTDYATNPLHQEKILGLPGPDFSINGRFAIKISQHSDLAFLKNLFPKGEGFRQRVEHTPNGSLRIVVFDQGNHQVAKYVRVLGYNHLLSTYEYDREDRLIKILPPLYHEIVGSAGRLTSWQVREDRLSPQEKQWQETLGTRFYYSKYGQLIREVTPDSGITAYLYNAAGQKRFMVSLDAANQTQKIVYFNYDGNNQLKSTGHMHRPLSLTALREHLENTHLPYAQEYQRFYYDDGHFDPLLRGRIAQFVTHNDGQVIIEKLRFDAQQQAVSKNTILEQGESDLLTNVEKNYVNGKLQKLIYPITVDDQPLHVLHTYNRLGQLVGLGTDNSPTRYATFTYSANGQLANEQYQPNTPHSFIRIYKYNSPGFLEQISDSFLTEDIAYTRKGYGQTGYGDGMVMEATFTASWSAIADGRWFQIRANDLGGNYSAVCIQALKRTGYLTESGEPVKLYVGYAEMALPLVCGGETGRYMAELVAKKQKPLYYGHRYTYGSHQELVKAKYFTNETESVANPFRPDSFAKEIPGLTHQQSQHIWQLLSKAGYIITDQQSIDPAASFGKQGMSFFRDLDLSIDLATLNDDYKIYAMSIKRLIVSAISEERTLALIEFETLFLYWTGLRDQESADLLISQRQNAAKRIYKMLSDKYLPTQMAITRALDGDFMNALQQYAALIPKIVQVLSYHFAYELGNTAFDLESYKIDANGNHHLFYTGFDRYELAYRNGTNQIELVKLGWSIELHEPDGGRVFPMKHDAQGNVIQALHKGIRRIYYHPVSQRTTRIQLTDNRILRFYYDAQGERVLKRVFDVEGKISHETHYLRDEHGRVLVDRQIKYSDDSTDKIFTAYLYGPRGLLGFIRNNNFYSVTTDHSGSVRLVIKDGGVVAAYDYLPYGQLMRSYGNDPQSQIIYRYTGQEWDEETDLYNYHARLYDPSIGRFYQPDPKAQYFSPYKYAGNSPISVIDPDGEFALALACIVLGTTGAYLGGAGANDRWNPVDWDINDSGTWLGIAGGGIAGALTPVTGGASVQAIGVVGTSTLGVGLGYVTTASVNQDWDPSRWKWDRPSTWSALFEGTASGIGIAGGISGVRNFAKGLSFNPVKVSGALTSSLKFGGTLNSEASIALLSNLLGVSKGTVKAISLLKSLFLTVSGASGIGTAYTAGATANKGNFVFWEWDWTNPATYVSLEGGFDVGIGWPQNILEMGRGLGKFSKNPKRYLFSGQNSFKLTSILKDSKHPLYGAATGAVMAYFMGSAANGDFDITKWDLAVFSTYEGVLNGVFLSKDIRNMLKYTRNSKVIQPPNQLVHVSQTRANNWPRKVSLMVGSIQRYRIGAKYQHLVETAFSESKLWLSRLGGQSHSVKIQVDSFFKGGLRKWKNGENRQPQELQRLLLDGAKREVLENSELGKWQAESEEAMRRQDEVFPVEDIPFLNCERAARRRKRAFGTSCIVRKRPEEEFKFNTISFLQKNPISTKSSWEKFQQAGKSLNNGKILDFTIKKSEAVGYHLAPAAYNDAYLTRGYWLSTSGKGAISDANAKITVNAHFPEARFIFTGEMQGCSLCIKYDKTNNDIEVYHYNRPDIDSIYINEYLGESIVEGKNRYVTNRGSDIPELSNVMSLTDINGNIISSKDNVIPIDQPLFKRLQNGNLKKIETINGKSIEEIIQENEQNLKKEQELAQSYGTIIRWEDYLGFPYNYVLLQNFNKIPKTYATMLLYFDDGDLSGSYQWQVISQKITYPGGMMDKEEFILGNDELYHVEIETNPILPRAYIRPSYIPYGTSFKPNFLPNIEHHRLNSPESPIPLPAPVYIPSDRSQRGAIRLSE